MSAKYEAHSTEANVLTTTLNSLVDGGNKITGIALSNDDAAERRLFGNFRLHLAAQGSARNADAMVHLYIIPEVGGIFAYGGDSLDPARKHHMGSFEFDPSTNARDDVLDGVRLPNSDFHVLLTNSTGRNLAATGNTLTVERDGYEDV